MKYRFFSSAVICAGVAACGTGGGEQSVFLGAEPRRGRHPIRSGEFGRSLGGRSARDDAGWGRQQFAARYRRCPRFWRSLERGGRRYGERRRLRDERRWIPPGGSGGSTVVMPPPPGNSGACNFTFNVTTVTAHGIYSPNNVGALWIEDSGGKFVKSLEVWGSQRLSNLTAWTSVSGNNTVDAVTSATLRNHGPHSGKWNCSDVNHVSVPNGSYQACVSFAEDDSFGGFFGAAPHVACIPFNKGVPATVSPPDQPNFTAMTLIMQ